MIRLSAFADEIAPELNEQVAALEDEHIHYLDLRGVWGTNVLDLTDEQIARIKRELDAHQMGVAEIGSPVGKVPIDTPFHETLHRFERAIKVAQALGTPFIRIFSFYQPSSTSGGGRVDPATYRDQVIDRLRELTERARAASITLLHENERDIYGDTIARCVDVLESIHDAHLQAVLDPANFIQCGETPFPDAYDALRPGIRYVHVKDALPDGKVVAAGEGAGRWPDLLRRLRADGYDGFLGLEPHLAEAGRLQGFSGPALFRHATQSLRRLLDEMGWEYA